jgi:alkanesulfonate monooxygenase SsuD/methylene tetrahydromethanopterin reductase-like flavin-dependent oxidoreductase (luciferase family)
MELSPPARPDMKILIGSTGPRMLRIGLAQADLWNCWWSLFGNRAEGIGELQQTVDDACADVGRDPSEIERTAAVYVQLEGGTGREAGDPEKMRGTPPIKGTHEDIAEQLHAFGSAGVGHLQVVLDPITAAGVEELAQILQLQ